HHQLGRHRRHADAELHSAVRRVLAAQRPHHRRHHGRSHQGVKFVTQNQTARSGVRAPFRESRGVPNNRFFNAHHSPIGAFASFTLGFPGPGGGLDLELGQPPRKNVDIGAESVEAPGLFEALPFFELPELDESARFDVERTGLMGLDSARVMGGSETTTYDSLDPSLGQARNNIYLGGKIWAAYVALEKLFAEGGRPDLAEAAAEQARRSAATMVSYAEPDGTIPAIV